MSIIIRLTETQYQSFCQTRRLDALLTPTERQIAILATRGYATKEIAHQLGKSPKTIDRHIESITEKARQVFGTSELFRNRIVPQLYCLYFLTNRLVLSDERAVRRQTS